MKQNEISKDHVKRVNKVLNFISDDLIGSYALEKLASVANYSPFHFQKIFKEVVGTSPKQYLNKLRLEKVAHSVLLHRHKSIKGIALENGFSSSSVFARTFKNYFGISAGQLRQTTPIGEFSVKKMQDPKESIQNHDNVYNDRRWKQKLDVKVLRIPTTRFIYIKAPLSDNDKIRLAFIKIMQLAEVNNLIASKPKFAGLIYPHQDRYCAAVLVNIQQKIPDEISSLTVEGGKYASFHLRGNSKQTFQGLHTFYDLWLPHSGYRIKNSFVVEFLTNNPATTSYSKIDREITISLETA